MAFHGLDGWYIGPAPQHYRCVTCYVPQTRKEIVSDTIKFIPTYIPFPETSIEDHIKKSLDDVTSLLKGTTKPMPLQHPESSRQAYIEISQLLNRNKHIPQITSEGVQPKNTQQSNSDTIVTTTTKKNNKNTTTNTSTKPKPVSNEEFEEVLR